VLGHNHFDDDEQYDEQHDEHFDEHFDDDSHQHDLDDDLDDAYVPTESTALHRRHSVLQQNLRQSQLPRLLLRVPLPWRVLHRRRNVL
jgi:hypothetical protein